MFGKCIMDFFKMFDFSDLPFTFTYKSNSSYQTTFSGIISFLYIIAAALFLIGGLIPFFKKENFTLYYYTMNMEQTEVLNFYDKSVAFAFGLDCRDVNKAKKAEELLNLNFGYTSRSSRSHENKRVELDVSHFHICTEEDFRSEFSDYYEVLGLRNYYCLNKDQILNDTVQGIYTDDIFEYFYIKVSAKNNTDELYEKITTFFMQNDCKLQFYCTDTILDIYDYKNPITYFMDQYFLQLNPHLYSKKNIFYLNYHLYNYSSFLNELDWFTIFKGSDTEPRKQMGLSRIYDYFEYKGLNRTMEIFSSTGYATMYIRADNRRIEVQRNYQDINEFYGDNYILFDLYNFILFLLGYYNDFFCRRSIKHKLFFYENNPENKIRNNSIKNLFCGNKENMENKNSTIDGLKLDNVINNDNSINIYNINKFNNIKNFNNTINNNDNDNINKTNNVHNHQDLLNEPNPETKAFKKGKRMYELSCFQRFKSCFFCCCDWTFHHGNNTIYSPDDFIDEKLDIIYYIKNMLLLELINQVEFENKKNFINFLITPIIESKRLHKPVETSANQNEEESEKEEDEVDDFYKEASELEFNKVSEEIMDSMKNQRKEDIKLINMLEKKINDYDG